MFTYKTRIYYDNTDVGGVVYHGQYCNLFERARTEWLRQLGYNHISLAQDFQGIFVVKSIKLDFIKPTKLDDAAEISCEIIKHGRSSVIFKQILSVAQEIKCQADVLVVYCDSQKFTPKKIPFSLNL